MADNANHTPIAPAVSDQRGLSQFLFVTAGIAIILGGLWTLYMGDAPYHPNEVTQSIGGMSLTVYE